MMKMAITMIIRPPHKRLLEGLSEGMPRQIASYEGVAQLSAIEWVAPAVHGLETKSQEDCLTYVHEKLSSIKPSMHGSLLIRSSSWNSGSRLARYRGAWSAINASTRLSWLAKEASWEVTSNESSANWGYAELLSNDPRAMLEAFRKFEGVALFSVRQLPLQNIQTAVESFDMRADFRPIDVAIRLTEREPVVLCWVYPSFDDREVAVYLIGTTVAIRRLYSLI